MVVVEDSREAKLAKIFDPKRMIANMKNRKSSDVKASIAKSKYNTKLRIAEAQIDNEALSTKFTH